MAFKSKFEVRKGLVRVRKENTGAISHEILLRKSYLIKRTLTGNSVKD